MAIAKVVIRNEFKEIMSDFTNPLEIIREAIQNALDAGATIIIITIVNNDTPMGKSLDIIIEDNGCGLPIDKFSNFFDLGNSTKANNPNMIGEKGHGTKIFYNSNSVKVESWINWRKYESTLENPYVKIYENRDIDYSEPVEVNNTENKEKGLRITIRGYLKNTSNSPLHRFSHPDIKDYILWFTGFGSIIKQFSDNKKVEKNKKYPKLYLKTYDSNYKKMQDDFNFQLNSDGYEEIEFGHVFPIKEIYRIQELKQLANDINIRNWEDLFCKKLFCDEVTIDGLESPIQVLIWAEGDKCKRQYNSIIKERVCSTTRDFQYKVSDRYGFWVCKNYIPIQKVDHWITGKGNYTKFHAFINYDKFNLTANRSSIENTRPEDLNLIQNKIDKIFQEVINDKDYKNWRDIEESAAQERSYEMEEKEFLRRIKNYTKRKKLILGNLTYFEPTNEGETILLFNGILENFKNILNLDILDYNTYKGIDFLVKNKNNLPPEYDSSIGYIEVKYSLDKTRFNHSFKNLRKIVCYNSKGLIQKETITDLNGQKLKVVKNHNGYFLQDFNNEVGHNIEIFIIKDFLEKKGMSFHF